MSNILLTRRHRILDERDEQLRYNRAALGGGRPYIDLRLHRAPNESDISWNGTPDGATPGRKRRAYLINDAGRIAGKINQYLFAQPVARDGIDAAFEKDATTTGLGVARFWEHVSDLFTAGQWVWLHCDRGAPEIDPETSRPKTRTLLQREAAGDRIYWSAWPSSDIIDWRFDALGRLVWLIAADEQYNNEDPEQEAKIEAHRILWRAAPGGATWSRYKADDKSEPVVIASGSVSTPEIPFILLGQPSADPWWFDDVEMMQCALLNLASLHHENLTKTVYPQLIIPQLMAENLQAKLVERYGQDKGRGVVELVRELIRGLDRPFIEDQETNGITRYLQPSSQDLKAIPDEEDRRRRALFDMVGLGLFNRESRQVQSAEAKQFDHLDTAATLKNRALLMQEAEGKLVELSRRMDTSFKPYQPAWPMDFDVPNTTEDVAALTQIANFAVLTPTMRKVILKTALRCIEAIETVDEEERKTILAEIQAMTEAELEPPAPPSRTPPDDGDTP